MSVSPPAGAPLLVTCGLPYANGPCHVGHLRTYVPGDVYVRMLRKMGERPVFVCGSDTHGTPILVNAEELGVPPRELVERYHRHFEETFAALSIRFDVFGSTDSPENHRRTAEVVEVLRERGHIYPRTIELAHCPKCNRFLPDRYVEGICPHCGSPARGDECDLGCRRHLEPGEIKDPRCRLCGSPARPRPQEHYFFRLSRFRDFLLDYLEKLEGTPNARHYAREWVQKELRDWCITRNLEWGVKFPGSDLVVYVWVDAPIGYIAFTPAWESVWKKPSRIVHFIGGDIVYHHCIFWPALLQGAGYTLPRAVVASGMLTIEGNKFSKSRGYVVWVKDDYLDRGLHPDLLRYYLTATTSHTRELDFSWRLFQEKVNNELVAILGNFAHRTLSFTQRNFGRVPGEPVEPGVAEKMEQARGEVLQAVRDYEFKKMVDGAISLAVHGNGYFQAREPWKLLGEDRATVGSISRGCLQMLRGLSLLLEPVMPRKMEELWQMLGETIPLGSARLEAEYLREIPAGRILPPPRPLFEKLEDEKVLQLEAVLRRRLEEARARGKKED
ncbi:MAG: methionine--tRNA ligase [Euryarchaeota archaeon]|nr:methionine--tRNA ligase [Euryarchaeota archaeon]